MYTRILYLSFSIIKWIVGEPVISGNICQNMQSKSCFKMNVPTVDIYRRSIGAKHNVQEFRR